MLQKRAPACAERWTARSIEAFIIRTAVQLEQQVLEFLLLRRDLDRLHVPHVVDLLLDPAQVGLAVVRLLLRNRPMHLQLRLRQLEPVGLQGLLVHALLQEGGLGGRDGGVEPRGGDRGGRPA